MIESLDHVITAETFQMTTKAIVDTSIQTVSEVVGETSEATITFTPKAPIVNPGRIEIEAPILATQVAEGQLVTLYPFGGECTSEQFTTLTQEVVGSVMTISYDMYTGNPFNPIKFVCKDWKNPITQTIQDGYKIRVFGESAI
jgi:2',3'-cyclic-nucleotide 2'-phosphodiesterase (5'-nucleotidase family)